MTALCLLAILAGDAGNRPFYLCALGEHEQRIAFLEARVAALEAQCYNNSARKTNVPQDGGPDPANETLERGRVIVPAPLPTLTPSALAPPPMVIRGPIPSVVRSAPVRSTVKRIICRDGKCYRAP